MVSTFCATEMPQAMMIERMLATTPTIVAKMYKLILYVVRVYTRKSTMSERQAAGSELKSSMSPVKRMPFFGWAVFFKVKGS